MTSHSFQDWQDNNLDPQADNGQQAALNTLRDILALMQEDLPATTVAARVQAIARAVLDRLGVVPVPEVDDLGGPSGQWCHNDPVADDNGLANIGPELQPEAPPF
jgi:hypothetical protein